MRTLIESRMYFRHKQSQGRFYLQIVESHRTGDQVRQRVIATLVRLDELESSGQLDRLLRSGARFVGGEWTASAKPRLHGRPRHLNRGRYACLQDRRAPCRPLQKGEVSAPNGGILRPFQRGHSGNPQGIYGSSAYHEARRICAEASPGDVRRTGQPDHHRWLSPLVPS